MKWLNLFLAAMFCFAIAGCGAEEGVVEGDEVLEQQMEEEYSEGYEEYENEGQ